MGQKKKGVELFWRKTMARLIGGGRGDHVGGGGKNLAEKKGGLPLTKGKGFFRLRGKVSATKGKGSVSREKGSTLMRRGVSLSLPGTGKFFNNSEAHSRGNRGAVFFCERRGGSQKKEQENVFGGPKRRKIPFFKNAWFARKGDSLVEEGGGEVPLGKIFEGGRWEEGGGKGGTTFPCGKSQKKETGGPLLREGGGKKKHRHLLSEKEGFYPGFRKKVWKAKKKKKKKKTNPYPRRKEGVGEPRRLPRFKVEGGGVHGEKKSTWLTGQKNRKTRPRRKKENKLPREWVADTPNRIRQPFFSKKGALTEVERKEKLGNKMQRNVFRGGGELKLIPGGDYL